MVALFTVTFALAVLPFAVFAVIVVVPTFLAVILPPETVATAVLLLVQLTERLVALLGETVAVNT